VIDRPVSAAGSVSGTVTPVVPPTAPPPVPAPPVSVPPPLVSPPPLVETPLVGRVVVEVGAELLPVLVPEELAGRLLDGMLDRLPLEVPVFFMAVVLPALAGCTTRGRPTLTMMSPNCSGSPSRPRVSSGS